MDRDTPRPLSVEEAKARLREAADNASPSAWFKRHPLQALTAAVIGGFVVARMRMPMTQGLLLAQRIVTPFLFGSVRRK